MAQAINLHSYIPPLTFNAYPNKNDFSKLSLTLLINLYL